MNITVKREPADKQGENIVDSLLTTTAAASSRGKREIDYSCSDRKEVSCILTKAQYVAPGAVTKIQERTGTWTGQCTYWSLTLSLTADAVSIDTRIAVEKEA